MSSSWFEECFLSTPPDSPGWSLLSQKAATKTVPAGAYLFTQGSACQYFVVVVSGNVRVQYQDIHGNEIVLYRLCPAEVCNTTTLCLLADDDYPAAAYAETEVEIAVLNKNDFLQTLEDTTFREYIFSQIARRSLELICLVNEVAFLTVEERLIRYLINNGPHIDTTHREIATQLGTAREVVSRYLRRLTNNGHIQTGRKGIDIINTSALESMVEVT